MTNLRDARALKRSDKALLREVKRLVQEYAPKAELLLYGSAARGEATSESDYDVLVITPGKLSTAEEDAVYDAVYRYEVTKDAVVSIVFYSREEWDSPIVRSSPYRKSVARDCVAI